MSTYFSGSRWLLLGLIGLTIFFVNPLANIASKYNQEVTIGASAMYGTLRVVNGVMSVAKDADFQASGVVASITASPGQLLQPVTNTIDRMTDLLFCLAIGSGVLTLIIVPVAKISAVGLTIVSLVRAALSLSRKGLTETAARLAHRVLFLCVIGAIVVPSSYALAFFIGNNITEGAWSQATAVFQRLDAQYDDEVVQEQIEALTVVAPVPATPAPESGNEAGILQRLGSAVDASRTAIGDTVSAAAGLASSVGNGVATNTKAVLDGVAISADLFTASIQIAVAYLVKLLVLPFMIMFAAIYVLRSILV